MNVQKRNDVSIYCLSSGPILPEWLGDRAKRNLAKRDESIRRRIELIQDFQMPASSSKLVQSADGRYIIAAGTYPPRIKCYDVHDLSMKFERYVDAHVIDLLMLGEDYGKMAIMREDRTIDFHAPYGAHQSVRIPAFGRAMAYESATCELLIAAKGKNVFRLNLEEGRFSEPWSSADSEVSSSCIAVAPAHPLAAVGGDDGVVRFWDNRTPDSLIKPILQLDVHLATAGRGFADDILGHVNVKEITSLVFDPNGLYMACGTAGGLATVYDVRSSRPLCIQEHKNGTAVLKLKFHSSGNILSMDEKLVKVWRYKDSHDISNSIAGSVVVNVEGKGKLSDFILGGDEIDPDGYQSGLLLCANDQPKLESYYIPKIGLAPRWCSFLENVTEELEEADLNRKGADSGLVGDGIETIYENYKFVSRDEVEELGISNLIGTLMLRGYMHGFFMDINLYNRVKAVANPFAYEDYRKKKLKERLEAKRSSRIAPKKDISKKAKAAVNPELADRLKEKAESSTKAGKVASTLLQDNRFKGLFNDPAFAIDDNDENFKLRNPSGVAASRREENDLDSDDEASHENNTDEEEGGSMQDGEVSLSPSDGTDSNEDSDSDEDGFRGGKVSIVYADMYESDLVCCTRPFTFLRKFSILRQVRPENESTYDSRTKRNRSTIQTTKTKQNKRIVYEADDLESAREAGMDRRKKAREMGLPLAQRIALQQADDSIQMTEVRGRFGAKEIKYVPESSRKNNVNTTSDKPARPRRRGERRGVKELGLKRRNREPP